MGITRETFGDIVYYVDSNLSYWVDEVREISHGSIWYEWEAATSYITLHLLNILQDEILDDVEITYDDIASHVDTMLYDVNTDLYDVTHLFDLPVDEGLSYIVSLLGFDVRGSENRIVSIEGDILHQMDDLEVKVDTAVGNLWDYVYNTLEPRILVLENMLVTLTPAQIEDLKYIMENASAIADIIQGNVSFIISEVEKGIAATVDTMVTDAVKNYDDRLTILETIVGQHEYFFFDWLMDALASIIAPQQAIEDDLTASIEIIKGWITEIVTTQIDELKKEIEFGLPPVEEIPQAWIDGLKERLEITGDGNGGLSAEQIQIMINNAVSPVIGRINAVETAVSGLQIPTEKQIRKWIQEYPPTIKIADYIGAIDVLLAKQITDKITLPEDRISTVSSYIIADTIAHQVELEETVKPIAEVMTAEMLTSLTDIVEAFGTPEALISYLINAPEGQEEPMLDLMQVLLTMTFERGLI